MKKGYTFYTAKELKPKGWLKRQLEIQAEGLSGNLDRMWSDVRDSAWIGGGREGWERVPYWLDGFIPIAYLLENDDMKSRVKRYIDAIIANQKSDGWICPCSDEERGNYDTWAVLLISKVLTVYFDCSGDSRIPDVLYRAMKNYYELLESGSIKLFNWGKFRWFEGFVALNRLYSIYKEEWICSLAGILREQGENYSLLTEDWKRPMNRWRFETHIVNLAMMLKYEVVSCGLLGEEYSGKADELYDVLKKYNGTSVGLFTGDECLSGLSPIQGTELCSVVEEMYSLELLYAYTGDRKWAERLEVLAFNALPATFSDDMWTHQYVQMSNQIACVKFPGRSLFRTNSSDAHIFGLEPNFGCCTANFNQGWPKFALSAFMYDERGIISAVPVPSLLETTWKGVPVSIELQTEYPFENRLVYKIKAEKPVKFSFRVRIPSFAENITVDGAAAVKRDVLVFDREWKDNTVEIAFDTEPRLNKRPHGLYNVSCGSLVFSLPVEYSAEKREYTDNGIERKFPYCDYELKPVSDWSFAFAGKDFEVEHKKGDDVPFSSKEPRVVLKTRLIPINWGFEDGFDTVCAKLPESRKPKGEAAEKLLYPYGCAKLRMTELPLSKLKR